MYNRKLYLAAGLFLLSLGAFIPEETIIWFFKGSNHPSPRVLYSGTFLFKIALGLIGLYLAIISVIKTTKNDQTLENTSLLKEEHNLENEKSVLLGLLVIASLLRIYNLNIGIWFDEMLTHVKYMPLSLGEIASTYDDANNHLLFTLLARTSLFIFGDTIWAFRLPATLFGIASIWALYHFAKHVTNTKESLFCAALFTFSYHHIWFSQNARGYTALLFFTLISSTLLIRALKSHNPKQWLLYAATAFLGMYTHLTMVFVLFTHFIIYSTNFLSEKPKWNGVMYGFIPLTLLTFLAYSLVLPALLGGGLLDSGSQSKEMAWSNPIWALMEIVNSMKIGFTHGGIAIIAAAVFGIGVLDYYKTNKKVVCLLLIPAALGFFIMTSLSYTLFPRFFFFAMGFIILVAIRGAVVTADYLVQYLRFPTSKNILSTLICSAILLASILSLRYVYLPKQNFVGAIDLVEREKIKQESVITVGIAGFPFNTYYKKDWKTIKTIEELDNILLHTKRTWAIYILPVHAEAAYPGIIRRIKDKYDLVKRFRGSLNGGDVFVYREKSA